MAGLLSPDSSFYRALNSATDLVILNALTILGCVPVVTAGASLTACARVTADMVREEDDYIVRSWWASFKGNLRQSFGWWLPVLALLVLAVAENWLIGGIRGATLAGALTGLIALGTAIVVGILSWLCPLVAQVDNTVAGHVSSACILAGAHPVRTAANLAVGVAPLAFFLLVPDARGAVAWFAVLIGLSFTGYVHALIEKGPFDRLRSAQDPSGA